MQMELSHQVAQILLRTKENQCCQLFSRKSGQTGQKIKNLPLRKNSAPGKNNIFLTFYPHGSKCDQRFPPISESKSVKSLVFQCIYKGKVRGNKTVSKFGPFSDLSGKIRPKFCHGFVRPLTFTFLLVSFWVMWPSFRPVGKTEETASSYRN